MTAKKIYLLSSMIVYKGMLDLMDSQNGQVILEDYAQRILHFSVVMFDMIWTLRFNAAAIDRTRCEAALDIKEESLDGEPWEETRVLAGSVLRREFAMLDAMLLIGTPNEVYFGKAGEST